MQVAHDPTVSAPPAPSTVSRRGLASRLFALPRSLVSQNKRRYQVDGFDLDLCYLHPRIIVMGFPASGLERVYRNSRREVQRFLSQRHGDRFKVYNFCAEASRRYAPREFAGRVEYFPVEDHCVPTFHQILAFCEDAATWLSSDPHHVAVLHCKAGKGRAGMMACMLLLRMGFAASALAAIDCYNRERVHDRRGLTVTSQRKWVSYYERLLRANTSPVDHLTLTVGSHALTIEELVIRNGPTGVTPPLVRLRISQLDPVTTQTIRVFETTGHDRFLVHTAVSGCVQIEFHRVQFAKRAKKHFRVWFHTMYVSPDAATGRVVFDRTAMDWVARDRKMRTFPAAFDLEMRVQTCATV